VFDLCAFHLPVRETTRLSCLSLPHLIVGIARFPPSFFSSELLVVPEPFFTAKQDVNSTDLFIFPSLRPSLYHFSPRRLFSRQPHWPDFPLVEHSGAPYQSFPQHDGKTNEGDTFFLVPICSRAPAFSFMNCFGQTFSCLPPFPRKFFENMSLFCDSTTGCPLPSQIAADRRTSA